MSSVNSCLPSGWIKNETTSPTGLSTGKTRVYYTSPKGEIIRSLPDLQKALGKEFDLKNFDWRSGKMIPGKTKQFPFTAKSLQSGQTTNAGAYDHLERLCATPYRRKDYQIRTQGITPVVHGLHKSSRVTEAKDVPLEPVRQLFWMKSLDQFSHKLSPNPNNAEGKEDVSGDSALHKDKLTIRQNHSDQIPLPKSLKVYPSILRKRKASWFNAIHHLHYSKKPFIGQHQTKATYEKPLWLTLSADQPFIAKRTLTEADVSEQDKRVEVLRGKLAELKKKLNHATETAVS